MENNKEDKAKNTYKIDRREALKGFATVPALGALAYGVWRKKKLDHYRNHQLRQELNMSSSTHGEAKKIWDGEPVKLGIIGYGIRGKQLLKGAGFALPSLLQNWKEGAANNSNDRRYSDFMEQDDLNIVVNGVCELFDVRVEEAALAASNGKREGTKGSYGPEPKKYKNYLDLINAKDIDAVIIAAPDHWHARLAIDAAKAGKHVYVEKGLTRTLEEVFAIRDVIKETGVVFQLGHQGRQTDSYIKAAEAIEKGLVGDINLIEVCTNRNSPNGAWVYNIDERGSEETIDWKMFEDPCEVKHPFSAERFFRWRCWWDYGTGLSGDLLTHEYDAVNQIVKMGIPETAVSSGGVYFYEKPEHYIKEVREVPDVWNAVLEYPKQNFSLLYSASLANNRDRGKVIMGHDGHMELGNNLSIYACRESTRYKDKIKSGLIDPNTPIYSYIPGRKDVDAVASATEQYFAGRGLLYTYRGGKRVDTTHLHVAEWIQAIRENKQTSCNIDQAFEEGITSQMATLSYKENRKMTWDSDKEEVS
ncbi:MAG: Gfo/Idh/MocA family oxidoreductase [Bacteroidales bacterium]|jgi:predicted dehydrogenase|nr:Gfo/Idh/MocA family oxidoreductase [Bacteroidales bacterium]